MSNFANVTAQNAYYSGLTKISYSARYNKIGDPFLVDDTITELAKYTYGRVLYKSMYWYFQVTDLYVIAEGITEVRYQLDAWETFRYQSSVTLGQGQISRMTKDDTTYLRKLRNPEFEPYSEFCTDINQSWGSGNHNPCILGIGRNNTSDFPRMVCLKMVMNSHNYALANTSTFAKYINDAMQSVDENWQLIGLWYSSFCPDVEFGAWQSTGKNNVYWIKCDASEPSTTMDDYYTQMRITTSEVPADNKTGLVLHNSPTSRIVCCDERGNVVWTLPDCIYMDINHIAYLNMSMSSCQWEVFVTVTSGSETTIDNFSIACEPLDFYNDSWYAYQSTQRQSDIDMRRLNTDSGFINTVTSAATGAASGAMLGALGGPIGAVGGAILGAGASIAQGAINTMFQSTYVNPKEQEITDASYKKASDTLSLQGNGVNLVMAVIGSTRWKVPARAGAGFKVLTYDDVTQHLIDNNEEVYGNYVIVNTMSVDDEIEGYEGPLTCNCEVGGIPSQWAGQIQERLASGVYMSG